MRDSRSAAWVFVALAAVAPVRPAAAQCVGIMTEELVPPAVLGMATTDPGFVVRYWAWDDFNRRRGGTDQPRIVDSAQGLLLAELDWGDADVCHDPGPVERTAVLFETLGASGFGRWAIVNLGADPLGNVDVDASQAILGQVSSWAVPVPSPWIEQVRIGETVIEVDLGWALDLGGEALSDLSDEQGWPLPSVRGHAVYVINGPQATPRPWDWSFGHDLEADAVNGYSTDCSATLSLPRGIWNDVTVCFAVALTFDGDGDASGEPPSSRSVHSDYLGVPSPWLRLPEIGVDLPVAVVDLEAHLSAPLVVELSFTGQSEPQGAGYLVWIVRPLGRRVQLDAFAGGESSYQRAIELPPWVSRVKWELAVEMLDAEGRTIGYAVTVPTR